MRARSRRHRQAERGAQRDETARAQANALAAHVRTGQDGGVVQIDVDRHEVAVFGRELGRKRKKTPALERENRLGDDLGCVAAMTLRKTSRGDQHVELAECGCRRVEFRGVLAHHRRKRRAHAFFRRGNRIRRSVSWR